MRIIVKVALIKNLAPPVKINFILKMDSAQHHVKIHFFLSHRFVCNVKRIVFNVPV